MIAQAAFRPQVHRFAHAGEAVAAIAAYAEALKTGASARRAHGHAVADQDGVEEGFCLLPDRATERPLLIVGGMGPLAGAEAFRRACARFGDNRAILLYQACSVPDRTPAILAEDPLGLIALDMAAALAKAIIRTADLLPADAPAADCLIACNSAHFFLAPLKSWLHGTPRIARRVRLVSVVDSAVRALTDALCRRSLLLCTQGARVGRLFSRPAAEAGLRFEEPAPGMENLLMAAIYEGIKALDDDRAVALGNAVFESVLMQMGDIDGVLAGCTELPPLFDLLRMRGTPMVRAFLSRVTVIDPLEAAFDAIDLRPPVLRYAALARPEPAFAPAFSAASAGLAD